VASVISELRELIPKRPMTWAESNRIAELVAMRFLALSGIKAAPVPEEIISELPRVSVEREYPFKVSGVTAFYEGLWMVALNAGEPLGRQRFSLAHEFWHIIDAPYKDRLYPPQLGMTSHERNESVADRFAASVLMPKPWVRKAWTSGTQDIGQLARQFEVSREAMRVRLQVLGLLEPTKRCGVA